MSVSIQGSGKYRSSGECFFGKIDIRTKFEDFSVTPCIIIALFQERQKFFRIPDIDYVFCIFFCRNRKQYTA